MLRESPHFFFVFTDSKEDEHGSHFLLIKVVFSVKQPHCLSLSYGVIAHPKLSHLLSQWVSWAQGVWDVAVCWGRGKLCENCVGEAKKNITAWQQRCREWRTRRRSGGAREGGVECMGMGMTEGKVGVYVCVRACVCVCVGGGGGCWGNISGSVVRSYSSPCILMLWVGLLWWGRLEEREGMEREKRAEKRKRGGGAGMAMAKDGWRGLRDGQCRRFSLKQH